MARRVQRRLTFKRVTRGAPWKWRNVFQTGAPRTCLSHHREQVYYTVDDDHRFKIGEFDWLTRLYQHRGLSMASVTPEGHIAYFEDEWEFIRTRGCEWLEFVNGPRETVSRIDFTTALRYGFWQSTPRGRMFFVPIGYYSTEE